MKILYLHGYGNRPGGTIPTFLSGQGHELLEPDLPDEDFEESVRVSQQVFDQERPDVVLGYSRGGALAMNIQTESAPLVLIAPGWKYQGQSTTVKTNTILVNSEKDDLVPLKDGRELLRRSGLPENHLVVAGEDHGMLDERALQAIKEAIADVGV